MSTKVLEFQREKLLVSVGYRISPRGFNFDVILGEGANFNQLRLLSGGLTAAVGAAFTSSTAGACLLLRLFMKVNS